ncbi:PQQ-binding-like beta-propeller repeat protein, partial [Verrucomicrobiota bacterium]
IVQPDEETAAAARLALNSMGLYGGRVVVMHGRLDEMPFADYFADVIISTGTGETIPTPPTGLLRLLKPCGGVARVGLPAPASLTVAAEWVRTIKQMLARMGDDTTAVVEDEGRITVRRGPLPGAGAWTHQYARPDNTACSDDTRVRGPLGVLWFGEPGAGRMPSRHSSAAAPLAIGGRMFVQGEDVVMAYDAYNGLFLWQREIPGATRLGIQGGRASNLVANEHSLFVVAAGKCLQLDAASGETIRAYKTPESKAGAKQPWGEYVACVGDLLFGSCAKNTLFAIKTGGKRPVWTHTARDLMAATVCIDGGRLFYVDRSVTDAQRETAMTGVDHEPRVDRLGKPVPPDVRLAVAVDAATGEKQWEHPEYVSDCIDIGRGGGDLTAMVSGNVLVLCAQPWNGHFWREFLSGAFARRSLIALDATTGAKLWSDHKGYRSRPIIVGDKIVAEPWAHDLRTGAPRKRVNPITGIESNWQFSRPGHHCGNICAAPNVLFFRSGKAAYYDLIADHGTAHFGAQRPGCWINIIPANGVVMMPEASSGCVCAYPLQCTTVFYPRATDRSWGVYSAAGDMNLLSHLCINLGAPGDRRVPDGRVWLGYPRPAEGRLVTDPGCIVEMMEEAGGFYHSNDAKIPASEGAPPWVMASGCDGIKRCTVRLIGAPSASGNWTVRLLFAEPGDAKPGDRVFDIGVEGAILLSDFDIVAEAKAPHKAVVKEFKDVRVTGTLDLTFEPKKGRPLLCGVQAELQPAAVRLGTLETRVMEGRAVTIALPVTLEDGAVAAARTAVTRPPAHGVLTPLGLHRYTYAPGRGYVGKDTFGWTVPGALGKPGQAEATIILDPDTEPPRVESMRVTAERGTVVIRFTEAVDKKSAEDPDHYAVSGGCAVESIRLGTENRAATLSVTGLTQGVIYTVTARDVADRAATSNRLVPTATRVTPDGIVVSTCDRAPTIDGDLTEPCWTDATPIPFRDDVHADQPIVRLLVCRGSDALYLACQRGR